MGRYVDQTAIEIRSVFQIQERLTFGLSVSVIDRILST